FLNGSRRDARLGAVCEALGSALLRVAGFPGDTAGALASALASGRAAETFAAMCAAQGADPGALATLVPEGDGRAVRATRDGYVASLDAVALGECARDLVARSGRGAGIRLAVRGGDFVRAGDALARVYGSVARDETIVAGAFAWSATPCVPRPLFYGEIDAVSAGVASGGAAAGRLASRSTLETK
ncbi:MAG: hypothetical protein IAI49_10150, partial [Candidatus Eremiobacteraeota bacterium]|nr:hypothetical protein [Candidatus Eremiobacteraeota bacterium]